MITFKEFTEGKYFHPGAVPSEVIERSLQEIDEFLTNFERYKDDAVKLGQYAHRFAYELKNMLVAGKTKSTL